MCFWEYDNFSHTMKYWNLCRARYRCIVGPGIFAAFLYLLYISGIRHTLLPHTGTTERISMGRITADSANVQQISNAGSANVHPTHAKQPPKEDVSIKVGSCIKPTATLTLGISVSRHCFPSPSLMGQSGSERLLIYNYLILKANILKAPEYLTIKLGQYVTCSITERKRHKIVIFRCIMQYVT